MLFVAASLLFLQDKAAEEMLRRMMESVEKAGSVKVIFRDETVETDADSGKQITLVTTGLLAIGRPEKLYYRTKLLPQDPVRGLFITLDERDLVVQVAKDEALWRMNGRQLRERMLHAFSRGGGTGLLCWLGEPLMDPVKGRIAVGKKIGVKGDPQAVGPDLQVSDIRRGSEGELTYALKGSNGEVRVALTFDPKTMKPLKRVATLHSGKVTTVQTEVYHTFEIDEGMSDDQFGALTFESAEYRALRKIEAAIQNASSLQLRFSVEVTEPMKNGVGLPPMKGSIVLKEGGMTVLTVEPPNSKDGGVKATSISDGVSVGGQPVFRLERCKNPPKVMQEALKVCLARPGLLLGTYIVGYGLAMSREENVEPDFGAAFPFEALKEGEEDQGLKTLTYDLDRAVNYSVKLWYDPKDFHLVKRLLTPMQEGGGTYLETYSEWKVDAAIADEVFKVPSK